MESCGIEGKVMISESTKQMLEKSTTNPFRFKWEKQVESKASEKPI